MEDFVFNFSDYENVKLPSLYSEQIHLSKYSRWDSVKKRRETWPETVLRYMTHMRDQCFKLGFNMDDSLFKRLFEAILYLKVMPSMRGLMTAGPALARDEAALYNCSYLHVDSIDALSETMYLLMVGSGVGFSVEKKFIEKLPILPKKFFPTDTTIVVEDSRIGWASALKQYLTILYSGYLPKVDVSKVRPAGAVLKTFGGKASGPGPLRDLFNHVAALFQQAVNNGQSRLNSLQVHSIMTKIGDCVVSGGTRRSAMLSLSDQEDSKMREAKTNNWYIENPHFSLANNSAVWLERPDVETFLEEFVSLIKSRSGERGIFNRKAAALAASRSGRRNVDGVEYGTNPCSEIILKSCQHCNLTEVIVREEDDEETLLEKIECATILGTIQSTFTNFRYLRDKWRENDEEERLLGVSLSGIMDNKLMSGKFGVNKLIYTLGQLKERYILTNKVYAEKLGINPSTAIGCVKPSGSVSQLVDCASGIHPRHSPYYIRSNRFNKSENVGMVLSSQGVYSEEDIMRPETGMVLFFPMKSPEDAICRKDLTAVQHLQLWLIYQTYYCEHKPSVTISVRPEEWIEVAEFVYKHFDLMTGVSFLPMSDHNYKQLPYQECTEEEYLELLARTPIAIDWSVLHSLEIEDNTEGARMYTCTGGSCELE